MASAGDLERDWGRTHLPTAPTADTDSEPGLLLLFSLETWKRCLSTRVSATNCVPMLFATVQRWNRQLFPGSGNVVEESPESLLYPALSVSLAPPKYSVTLRATVDSTWHDISCSLTPRLRCCHSFSTKLELMSAYRVGMALRGASIAMRGARCSLGQSHCHSQIGWPCAPMASWRARDCSCNRGDVHTMHGPSTDVAALINMSSRGDARAGVGFPFCFAAVREYNQTT
jgi:hypothetical protein